MSTTIERYEALCQKHGLDPNALPDVSKVPEKRKKYIISCERIAIIAECYNKEDKDGNILDEGWIPNYSDYNQRKYEIWFRVIKDTSSVSGFGLAYGGYVSWSTLTFCGGRLCFKTSALGEYVTKKHAEIFRDFLTINK